MSKYSRNDWLFHTQFHLHADGEILAEVKKRVSEQLKQKGPPVILLDLDSTLYEVGPRTLAILKEWNQSPSAQLSLQSQLNELELKHIGYSLFDTLKNMGFEAHHPDAIEAVKHLKPFWWDRFFSNSYLSHDRPYHGAVKFVQELFQMGAHLIYLTGRDEKKMKLSTIKNLERDQFPICATQTQLVMKTRPELDDKQHKQSVAGEVHKRGVLIASFENEPQNLIALQEIFPKAMHVFMETVSSHEPAPVGKNLYRLKHFHK